MRLLDKLREEWRENKTGRLPDGTTVTGRQIVAYKVLAVALPLLWVGNIAVDITREGSWKAVGKSFANGFYAASASNGVSWNPPYR